MARFLTGKKRTAVFVIGLLSILWLSRPIIAEEPQPKQKPVSPKEQALQDSPEVEAMVSDQIAKRRAFLKDMREEASTIRADLEKVQDLEKRRQLIEKYRSARSRKVEKFHAEDQTREAAIQKARAAAPTK